jgi:hypothetical protein
VNFVRPFNNSKLLFFINFGVTTIAMFNLRLLQEIRGQIPLPKGQSLTHFVSDSETGRIYCLTGKYDVVAYDPLKNTASTGLTIKIIFLDQFKKL